MRIKDAGGSISGGGNVSGKSVFTGPMDAGVIYTFTHGLGKTYYQMQVISPNNNEEVDLLRVTPGDETTKIDIRTQTDISVGLTISILGHD